MPDSAAECGACSPPSPALPRFRWPWGMLAFTAFVWFVAHASFRAKILFPFLVLAVLVMTLLFAVHGIRRLLSPTPERSLKAKTALVRVVLTALAAVGSLMGTMHLSGKVERAMQPVIDAAERFHTEKGRYPSRADELVPGYISAVPLCPNDDKQPLYMLKQPGTTPIPGWFPLGDDGFILTCSRTVLWEFMYYSPKHKWVGRS